MTNKDLIHIIIVSSEYYAPYLAILLKSLVANKATDDNLDIHIVSEDISSVTQALINRMFPDISIHFKLVNNQEIQKFGNCTLEHMKSNICNYKLKFAELFEFDKAICLECDMIVLGSLKKIYSIDIDKHPIAAVKDPCCNALLKHFNINNSLYHYFNTGLFVANFRYWRENNTSKTFFSISEKWRKDSKFANLLDQNVFNIAFHNKVKFLPNNAQFFPTIPYDDQKLQREAQINPTIIHYASPEKPWNCPTKLSNLFWYYADQTPFYEELWMRMMMFQLRKFIPKNIVEKKEQSERKLKIFGLPILKIKYKLRRQKYYLFSLPIWTIRYKGGLTKCRLFGFIPILTIRTKIG